LSVYISKNNQVKIIDKTPPDYACLFKKCWSSDLDQRPTLIEILKELEKLSANAPVEFVSNNINNININNQLTAQPKISYSESLDSLDNKTKNLNSDEYHDESQDKFNDDPCQKNNTPNESSNDLKLESQDKFNDDPCQNNTPNDLALESHDQFNGEPCKKNNTPNESSNNLALISKYDTINNTLKISNWNKGLTLFRQRNNINVINHKRIEEPRLVSDPLYGDILKGYLKQTAMMKYIHKDSLENKKFEEQ
ncbi:16953_t:CDS:2, partial [Dentiscutata heterogama]